MKEYFFKVSYYLLDTFEERILSKDSFLDMIDNSYPTFDHLSISLPLINRSIKRNRSQLTPISYLSQLRDSTPPQCRVKKRGRRRCKRLTFITIPK